MLWGVSAQRGTSRGEARAFIGNKMRLSRTQLIRGGARSWPNPDTSHENTVAGPAVCHQAPERRLTSPRVGFAMLPEGYRSISVLPAFRESSASAPTSPALKPVPRDPAPQAGQRWVHGAKGPGRAAGASVT